MTTLTKRFWFWAVVQTAIVSAIVGWRFYVGVSEYLAHPTDGDMYAHTWGFQFGVFTICTLPMIVGSVAVLLTLEWFITRKLLQRQRNYEKTLA